MLYGSYGCDVQDVSLYGQQRKLENPYVDFASRMVPKTFADVIDWSEHVATLNDDLGVGLRRLYTYFATPVDVDVLDLKDGEHDMSNAIKWEMLLKQSASYLSHVTQLGMNVAVYGNDFVTCTLKHQRFIVCPRCGTEIWMKTARKFSGLELRLGKDLNFSGFCQSKRCKGQGRTKFKLRHQFSQTADNLVIKHWPIRELEFDYLDATDDLRVYWRIPQRVKNKVVKEHDVESMHDWDMSVLEAIVNNKLLAFDDRVMFHGKEPHLSGLENKGLGIPRTLSLARQHWLVQLLKKQCQALAQTYVMPMKFFSMDGGGGGLGAMDPVQMSDARIFSNYLEQMISEHERDPRRSYYVPFPVKFQFAGGGADQFVPANLMQMAVSDLSTSLIPMPMLKGELNAQGGAMFLRMFEAFNREIPDMYNRFLWFMVGRISNLLGLESVGCQHQSAAVVDNIGVDSMLMQAAMMGKISDMPWMRRLGLNPKTESNRMLTQARTEIDRQLDLQKLQEEKGYSQMVSQNASAGMMAAVQPDQQGGGQGTPGGDPNAQGMGLMPGGLLLPSQGYVPPVDVVQMESAGQAMAQLLGQLPQYQRDQELSILRQNNSVFHSIVTAELRNLRQAASLEGRQMIAPTL